MPPPQTIGFPRMMKERGEKRVFLPEFIQFLTELGATVYVEEGYGSRSGYTFADYRRGSEAVIECSREEAFAQEIVLVLRSPRFEEFDLLKPGHCLMSMLHLPTRQPRVSRLQELGVHAISLDGIVDDRNLRLVENMRAVAWNGLEVAFDVLEGLPEGLTRKPDDPIRVLILGAGMVGKHAVEAATKLGNVERNQESMAEGKPGSVALTVGRSLTRNAQAMERLFHEADILVDATQRHNPAEPVVPNAWIAWLPPHAVITDLAVDPYLIEADRPVVRGVEGIPQGNLDQWEFGPDDPAWDRLPPMVPTANRRTVVSCYSWPGVQPEACMQAYGSQVTPLLKTLLWYGGLPAIGPDVSFHGRALWRASLRHWLESNAAA
jgi:alanine dehydrogenase